MGDLWPLLFTQQEKQQADRRDVIFGKLYPGGRVEEAIVLIQVPYSCQKDDVHQSRPAYRLL
jgi:hypothetical protein